LFRFVLTIEIFAEQDNSSVEIGNLALITPYVIRQAYRNCVIGLSLVDSSPSRLLFPC
jgi:hypothetical protein